MMYTLLPSVTDRILLQGSNSKDLRVAPSLPLHFISVPFQNLIELLSANFQFFHE